MQDGELGGLDLVGDEVAGHRALLAVQTDGAEHHLEAAQGDLRVGRNNFV